MLVFILQHTHSVVLWYQITELRWTYVCDWQMLLLVNFSPCVLVRYAVADNIT